MRCPFHLFLLSVVVLRLLALPARSADPAAPLTRAGVWLGDVTPGGPGFARQIAGCLERAGWQIEYLDTATLTNLTRLTAETMDLLVLPGARRLPLESASAIQPYLRSGGDLLAFGLPAWEAPVFHLGGRWMTRAEYAAALREVTASNLLLRFAADAAGPHREDTAGSPGLLASSRVGPADLVRWARHTDAARTAAGREATREIQAGETRDSDVLHVTLGGLTGWDTLEPPARVWSFPDDHTLTCFRAKGGPGTRQLAVEWIEQDGSRWIATVDLTPEWQNYALPPGAFLPWQPPAGRGGPGDRLNPRRLARFSVGLAVSHTAFDPGKLEYWFADLGSARNPFGSEPPAMTAEIPRLESLAPDYQCYSLAMPLVVRPPQWQALIPGAEGADRRAAPTNRPSVRITTGDDVRGLHPRPRGVGFRQNRPVRWQPLLVARDAETEDYRGAVGALVAHFAPPYRGGVWAVFTPDDPAFYAQPVVADWIEQLARRLRRPVYLEEGGSEFFTVFPDQPVPLGARIANLGANAATNLQVLLSVVDQARGKLAYPFRASVSLAPGERGEVATTWAPSPWPQRGAVVAAQLLADGQVIDELYHELNRWEPLPTPQFLEAREGGFWLAGQPWKAHGVNYLPSSGIGVASEYFEYWLGRGAYDPEVIERDLRRVKNMGLNAVSVFIYHRDLGAQHLLDFLFRCARLDLKVNLSLRPGTPLEFRWNEMKALIEHYRLARHDVVFGYDLAWEPSHFDHRHQQRHYAQAWAEWVRRRHGSTAAALTAWGQTPAPATTPAVGPADVPIPPMSELLQDGPWRRKIADYRAFLDDHLAAGYAEARRLVRSLDPHHPVSFRMQHAGDPTLSLEQLLPYDFYGLRNAVDIWEPEAYGRIGDWEQVRPGHFTAAYARLCDPAKPVLWAEMGYNAWDEPSRCASPAKLVVAARFYADFYRMLGESGADGVFFWWYPGGYRLNERSDFGIINPDGTDRAVTRVIRERGGQFLKQPKPPPPQYGIAVDRDVDARGLVGIYEAAKREYWEAVDSGKSVGLRWAREPGSR